MLVVKVGLIVSRATGDGIILFFQSSEGSIYDYLYVVSTASYSFIDIKFARDMQSCPAQVSCETR